MLPTVSVVGRPEEALRRLNDMAADMAPPFDKMTGFGKAWALADLGRLDEAREALAEGTDIANTFQYETLRPWLTLVAGVIDEEAGDIDSAVENYRTSLDIAIRVEPLNQVRLARVLRLQGHDDEAEDLLNAALKLEPAHPESHLEMAFVMQSRGDEDRAREHLAKAQAAWVDADAEFPLAKRARELAGRIN